MFTFNKTVYGQIVILLCLTPTLAGAQTAPVLHGNNPAVVQQLPADPVLPEGAMLDSDPRLKQKVTLRVENMTLPRVLAQLSNTTHLSLIADGDQLQTKKISATFDQKPLRDVLDAIAALGNYEWIGRKSGTIVLQAIPPVLIDKALEKQGKAILDLVNKMTPEQQQALSKPYGTALTDLPSDMQSAMKGALAAMPEPVDPNGQPIPYYATLLSNADHLTVGFGVDHQEDGDNYYLYYNLPNRMGGMTLVDHE